MLFLKRVKFLERWHASSFLRTPNVLTCSLFSRKLFWAHVLDRVDRSRSFPGAMTQRQSIVWRAVKKAWNRFVVLRAGGYGRVEELTVSHAGLRFPSPQRRKLNRLHFYSWVQSSPSEEAQGLSVSIPLNWRFDFLNEVTVYTLPRLKCIRFVGGHSIAPKTTSANAASASP